MTFIGCRAKSVAKHSSCMSAGSGLVLCMSVFLQRCKFLLSGMTLTYRLGSLGWLIQGAAFCGHRCTAITHSTCGTLEYSLAAPMSRVVRVEEPAEHILAVKDAFHDYTSFTYTSWEEPKNQSSNCKRSVQGGGVHSSTMFMAARASRAAI